MPGLSKAKTQVHKVQKNKSLLLLVIVFLDLQITISKSSKPHQERRHIAEYFSYDNTLPLLIEQEEPIQIVF